MIDQLEKEIQEEADRRSIEVLFRLLNMAELDANQHPIDMLRRYVSLKILRHKIKKKLRDGTYFGYLSEDMLNDKYIELTDTIKVARRKYYESKRRYEASHH